MGVGKPASAQAVEGVTTALLGCSREGLTQQGSKDGQGDGAIEGGERVVHVLACVLEGICPLEVE